MTRSRTKLFRSTARVLAAVALVVSMLGCALSQPTLRKNAPSERSVDAERLRGHVVALSEEFHPRSWLDTRNLDACATYIAREFESAGARVRMQEYQAKGNTYRNVIGRFGSGEGMRIILGAHYDTCGETPGADDNASGVSGLIELAHLIGKHSPESEIELVAYTLEEPPFFASPMMGSAVHADSVAGEKADIRGVIVLEMIGYFSDERGSQSYPSLLLKLIYPSKGDFISVVGPWDQPRWTKEVKVGMKGTTDMPVYSIRAPAVVPGIDFSDHRNYWPHGINAVMVTDTAFYRNKAYHEATDTADRLDYERMAQVVVAVYEAVLKLETEAQ